MEKQITGNKRKPFIILSGILILAAGIGAFFWIKSAGYETTDDAQLEGNIFQVRAGVTAYLDSIHFQDNQLVKQGDTLMTFNTITFKAQVAQAKAALENARAGLGVSDIKALAERQNAGAARESALSEQQNIAVASAKLEFAQKNFSRAQELLKIKAMTRQDYDAAQTMLQQAQADYQQSLHNRQSTVLTSAGLSTQAQAAHHQISAAAALVEQRMAELQLAQEQLNHAYIIAPCNGIVTKRSVESGQYILAGQSLCAVVDEQHLWITANFKETQLKSIKPGQPVQISVDAYPGLDLNGTVQSYGGATGAMFSLIPPDNASGNFIKVTQRFPLRIKINGFSGLKNKPTVLFPGLSAFVKIKID